MSLSSTATVVHKTLVAKLFSTRAPRELFVLGGENPFAVFQVVAAVCGSAVECGHGHKGTKK